MKQKILIVDDTPENISVLMALLENHYTLIAATNGEKALQLASTEPRPDLMLLDINMPGMDGYEVFNRLQQSMQTKSIGVIFITALSDDQHEEIGLELGAVDYIRKPFTPDIVRTRVHNQLELKQYKDHLEEMIFHRTEEIVHLQDALIVSMGSLAERRDPETGGHLKRTQHYVRLLAKLLLDHPNFREYLDENIIELLFKAAPLHDIGKVGVPDEILFKKGKLTDEEYEQMQYHVPFGAEVINDIQNALGREIELSQVALQIIEGHHEKWDGSGYPKAFKGREISIPGRIMAVADVYDALICKRHYKSPIPHSEAVQMISEESGTHFDPDIVEAFITHEGRFRDITLKFSD
ncbi:HD-GYP domain-containing protein [Solemya elarraichensis gill symbiont]|nr:HD domain-containing phosphohydrolase [Solemya elarraichensis gill symbiont]